MPNKSILKFTIGVVYALIAGTFGAKLVYIIQNHVQPSYFEIAELAVTGFILVALLLTAIASVLRNVHLPRFRRNKSTDDYDHDELEDEVDFLRDRVSEVESNVNDFDSRLEKLEENNFNSDTANLFIPVICQTDPNNGKAVPLYELPPVDSRQDAVIKAKFSIEARKREGMPVNGPVLVIKEAIDLEPIQFS